MGLELFEGRGSDLVLVHPARFLSHTCWMDHFICPAPLSRRRSAHPSASPVGGRRGGPASQGPELPIGTGVPLKAPKALAVSDPRTPASRPARTSHDSARGLSPFVYSCGRTRRPEGRCAKWSREPPCAPGPGSGPSDGLCGAGYLPAACSRATTSPIAHIWRTSSLATAVLATLAFLPAPTRSR